jgi:NTP pyrophosphatase (non-canonical NTP hydrolase)
VAADLSFGELAATNKARCGRWHPGFPDDEQWTCGDWGNAMQGEVGEAAEAFLRLVAAAGLAGNIVKKLRRVECSTVGAVDDPPAELLDKLGDELADVVIYADLLSSKFGRSLAVAIVRKFNAVSEREGFPERLRMSQPCPNCGGSGGDTASEHGCKGDEAICAVTCPVPVAVQCEPCGGSGRMSC